MGAFSETKKCFLFADGDKKMTEKTGKKVQDTGMQLNYALVNLLRKYDWVIEEKDEERVMLLLFAHRQSIREMISSKFS